MLIGQWCFFCHAIQRIGKRLVAVVDLVSVGRVVGTGEYDDNVHRFSFLYLYEKLLFVSLFVFFASNAYRFRIISFTYKTDAKSFIIFEMLT